MRSARIVCVAFVLLICSGHFYSSVAQLSGNAGLGFVTYRNAEGTDTSSGDRALTPSLDLEYLFKISPVASFKTSLSTEYSLYLAKPERSYYTLYPELSYKLYLSDQDAIRKEAERTTAVSILDSSNLVIAATLDALADSTITLRTGIEPTALKPAMITDTQSDIAATLLAYVGLLQEMGLTQSFKEVLLDELSTIRERVTLLGAPKIELQHYLRSIEALTSLLDNSIAESDFSLSASSSSQDETTPEQDTAETNSSASIITLISSTYGLERFSSSSFYPKYYLSSVYASTYATKLTIPFSADYKHYRPTYSTYSYTTLRLEPHLDWYPSHTVGFGLNYLFQRSNFPESKLYTFKENALRLDSRFELSPALALVAELGYGNRFYPNPMSLSDTLGGGPRPKVRTITSPSTYNRFSAGAALVVFPTERLALDLGVRITKNPADNVIYLGGVTSKRFTNSSYFGLASDESYIYEATAISGAATLLLPADFEITADVISEHRPYPPPPNIPGQRSTTRTDDALFVIGSASKYISFNKNLLGLFDSIYPRISATYTNITSTLSEFGYSDLSLTAAVSLGF